MAAAAAAAPLAYAAIEWRRRDPAPAAKDVLVTGPGCGVVRNRVVLALNGSLGALLFEATTPGDYALHYLPFVSNGAAFGRKDYYPPLRANGASRRGRAVMSLTSVLSFAAIAYMTLADCRDSL